MKKTPDQQAIPGSNVPDVSTRDGYRSNLRKLLEAYKKDRLTGTSSNLAAALQDLDQLPPKSNPGLRFRPKDPAWETATHVKVYTAASLALSPHEKEALKEVPLDEDSLPNLTSQIDENGNLKVSPYTAEILRRVASTLKSIELPAWESQSWHPDDLRPYIATLNQMVENAKCVEYTSRELKPLTDLIAHIESICESTRREQK